MFYDEEHTIEACEEEPSLIFELINEGYEDLIDKVLSKKKIDLNITDDKGNNVLQALLTKNYFSLVEKYIKNKDLDINHQNKNGDTLAHIVVTKKYLNVMNIIKLLLKKEAFIPNIRNKAGETILDKSINENYIATTVKILEDERFNNIDLVSFKNLYDNYIKSNNYGIYSKVDNLEIIMDNLVNKELLPKVQALVDSIINNLDYIINSVKNNEIKVLDNMINQALSK